MSIAGIAKEVTTITISAWFFGDELTPLNITGVAITVCGMISLIFLSTTHTNLRHRFCMGGIALFTYHKYRKSLESTVPLDAHGNPIVIDDDLSGGADSNQVELDETERLTSTRSLVSDDFDGVRLSLLYMTHGKYVHPRNSIPALAADLGYRMISLHTMHSFPQGMKMIMMLKSSTVFDPPNFGGTPLIG
jgi:hypothetical protein